LGVGWPLCATSSPEISLPGYPEESPIDNPQWPAAGGPRIPTWPKALQLDEGPAGAPAWSGTGWVGWKHWGTTLHPVRITVRDHPKLYEDDIEEVAVEHTPDVDYAVRCIPAVRPGMLTIARRRYDNNGVTSENLAPKRPLGISLGTRTYEIRVESKVDTFENATVVLSDGSRTQVLFTVNDHPDEPHLEVNRAGCRSRRQAGFDRNLQLEVLDAPAHAAAVVEGTAGPTGRRGGHLRDRRLIGMRQYGTRRRSDALRVRQCGTRRPRKE
jgi:hypothetical protein